MTEVVAKVEELRQGAEWAAACGSKSKAVYSLDNASIHGDPEALLRLGIDAAQWETSPPRSPDFHKPIEHVFGRMKFAFENWMHGNRQECSVKEYMEVAEALFNQCASKEQIAPDVASMDETYDKIVEFGVAGSPSRGGDCVCSPYLC